MANIRDIKRRITSVSNTQQITRAMKMVAAAKLRKAQKALTKARPYADKMLEVLQRIGEVTDITEHPLLEQREQKSTLYIVVTSDRGLCGSYNANVLKEAVSILDNDSTQTQVIVVGAKARDFFNRRSYAVTGEYTDLNDEPAYEFAEEITNAVIEYYLSGTVDSVKVVYSHFINTVSRRQEVIELLPLAPDKPESRVRVEYIFDPSPQEVLDDLLPRYIATTLLRVFLEARASEEGARMAAMDAATENAEDMIKRLTIVYNRARQAAITKEISEIVGGAEALK